MPKPKELESSVRLPLKAGHSYRTNEGTKVTLIERTTTTLTAPEVNYYFDRDDVTAPGTNCTLIEEIFEDPTALPIHNPDDLARRRRAMQQRLKELREAPAHEVPRTEDLYQ